METTTTNSLNSGGETTPLSLEMSFNNAYLKPSSNRGYYSSDRSSGTTAVTADTTATTAALKAKSTKSAGSTPRVIQYDPHMGTDQSTMTVILEQAVSNPNNTEEIRPMNVCFGQLIVSTSQQQQHAPSAAPNNTSNSHLMWITLVARVPRFSDTGVQRGEPVPLAVCTYTSITKDTAIETIPFGTFIYKNAASSSGSEATEIGRKRVVSEEFDTYQHQKRAHQQLDDEQQLFSQLLAPFDESPSAFNPATSNNSTTTNAATAISNSNQASYNFPAHHEQHLQPHPAQQHHNQPELQPYPSSLPTNIQAAPVAIANDSSNANTSYLNYQQHYSPSSLGTSGAMPTHQQQLQQLAGPPATHYNQQPHQQQQHQPYQFNLMPASMTAPLGNMKAHYYSSSTTNNGYTAATTGANPTASVSAPTYYGQTHTASSYPYQPQQPQQPYPYQQQHQPQSAISHPSTTQMIIPSVPMYDTNIAPFAGVLSKANLKIIGDLMEMTYGWNEREWANGRRLVQFWRRQHVGNGEGSRNINDSASSSNDNEVECGFKAIDQEEYQQQRIRENMASKYTATTTTTPNTINGHTASNSTNGSGSMMSSTSMKKANPLIISCIYWREHNDFYITSVDCIFLLEGLIGVEFTVEEKNRIRRNLEGFRPLTVSKCKPECSEFFKLIMGFPHPKPRNIEKDVKVFAWKTLPSALKKIIRKYTPSYSSTAVVNINAASGNNAL